MRTWGLRVIGSMTPVAKRHADLGFHALAGVSLGSLALIGWLQYLALWGASTPVVVAQSVVAAGGLILGAELARRSTTTLGGWLTACGLWAFVHPLWMGATADTLLAALAQYNTGWGLAFAAAVLHWLLPVTFWTAAAVRLCQLAINSVPAVPAGLIPAVAATAGLVGTAFWAAPVLGGEGASWCWGLACLGCGVWEWSGRLTLNSAVTTPASIPALWQRGLRSLAIGGIAALLAATVRCLSELMPASVYWTCGIAAGLVLGVAVGCSLRARVSAGGAMLLAAGWMVFLLATEHWQTDFCLWCSSTFTQPTLLLPLRAAFVATLLFPFGLALGAVASLTIRNGLTNPASMLVAIAAGCVLPPALWTTAGPMGLAAGATCLLLLLSAGEFWIIGAPQPMLWRRIGIMTALLLGVLTPWFAGGHAPAHTARLLFSTTVMMARRAGWDPQWLGWIDEQRLLTEVEGQHGAWTVWRSRGGQVMLREAGQPRGVMSARTELQPHYAPEVLHAVWPLVLADQPQRVMVLGGSSRALLQTCLEFPITDLTCVESDPALIALSLGAWGDLTAFHPEHDERFQWQSAVPELLVQGHTGDCDVILSCPQPSARNAGTACFTREHYRHVARCLTADGVFCQRLEGIDYGARPLQSVAGAMQQAFREVILFEPSPGEYLLVATNSPLGLVRESLRARLEAPQVVRALSRCGWDWSALTSLPAVDGPALREAVADNGPGVNTFTNGWLAWQAAHEVMRWGNKSQEVHALLLKPRTSEPQYAAWIDPAVVDAAPRTKVRAARLFDWMGQFGECSDILRRLGETTKLAKVVAENPDTFWWEYRKTLREQLKNHPRAALEVAAGRSDGQTLHDEDLRRKDYFATLGAALQEPKPQLASIAAVEEFFTPFDPLVTLCSHYEAADLYARRADQPARELALRMHVVMHAPSPDGSVRNVAECVKLLVEHDEALPDPVERFDQLNFLMQLLRGRWDVRSTMPARSYRMQVVELDTDVVLAERALDLLGQLAPQAGLSTEDWDARRTALDQIVVRPLRAYRTRLADQHGLNRMKTQELIKKAQEDRAQEAPAELPESKSAEPSRLPLAN